MRIKLEKQVLHEMARVGVARKDKGYKNNFVVYVDSEAGNRRGNAYFKVYDSTSYSIAEHVARIRFTAPSLVVGHIDSKDPLTVSSQFKKDLIKFLTSPHQYVAVTNWQFALYTWNEECGLDLEDPISFVNGDYDEKYKDDHRYLPSTTVMPNYELLP